MERRHDVSVVRLHDLINEGRESQEYVTTTHHWYISTTSQTSLKRNTQRRLGGTLPRRLSGTSPRRRTILL